MSSSLLLFVALAGGLARADGDSGTGPEVSADKDGIELPRLVPGKLDNDGVFDAHVEAGTPATLDDGARAFRLEAGGRLHVNMTYDDDSCYSGDCDVKRHAQVNPGVDILLEGDTSEGVKRVEVGNREIFTPFRNRTYGPAVDLDIRLASLGFEYRDDPTVGLHQAVGTIDPLRLSFHADGLWEGSSVHSDICGNIGLLGINIGENRAADEEAIVAMDWIKGGLCLGTRMERVGRLSVTGEGGVSSVMGEGEETDLNGDDEGGESWDYHDTTYGYLRGGVKLSQLADTPLYVKGTAELRQASSEGADTKAATAVFFSAGAAF